jgi:hypothetical protein
VTYLVTGLLLAASFGIVYGLTLWQISTNNPIITYIASISISLLNVLIGGISMSMCSCSRGDDCLLERFYPNEQGDQLCFEVDYGSADEFYLGSPDH